MEMSSMWMRIWHLQLSAMIYVKSYIIFLSKLTQIQKRDNFNTRSEIRRKAGSERSVFKNKPYIEAQIYQESKFKDLYCLLIKVIFKPNAKIKSPWAKCVIFSKITRGTKVANPPKFKL
nr:hypothetical protein [Tanacetum cinerariifolium]